MFSALSALQLLQDICACSGKPGFIRAFRIFLHSVYLWYYVRRGQKPVLRWVAFEEHAMTAVMSTYRGPVARIAR